MTFAPPIPDLGRLSDAARDAPIVALWTQLDAALAVYLHHCQAIGFERLAALRDIRATLGGTFIWMPAQLHRGEPLR